MLHPIVGLAAAMAVGLLLTRIVKLVHLPNVTGYLIAGLIVGPCCLNLLSHDLLASVEILVTLALGFIAFSIGGEFKLSHLRQIGGKAVTITLFQGLAAVALVDITLALAGFDMPLVLTLGAIATATAPAATLMVVRQYRAKGPVTQTLLPVVAMDDAVGLMVFSISIVIAQALAAHSQMSVGVMLGKPLLEITCSLGLGGLIGLVAVVALRFFHSRDNHLAVVIAAVLLGVGLSEMFELSSLLLCMAIGAVVVNLQKDSDKLLAHTDRWTPPLFLLFFVISGADLDLAAIPMVGLLGVLYILARSVGKYLGSYVGAAVVKADPSIRKYLGITLLPQAGVAIGMAQMASSMLPAYAAQIRTVVLCATLIYELVGPMLTKMALIKAGEIQVEPRVRAKAAAVATAKAKPPAGS